VLQQNDHNDSAAGPCVTAERAVLHQILYLVLTLLLQAYVTQTLSPALSP
jgi:hypothetical protein